MILRFVKNHETSQSKAIRDEKTVCFKHNVFMDAFDVGTESDPSGLC